MGAETGTRRMLSHVEWRPSCAQARAEDIQLRARSRQQRLRHGPTAHASKLEGHGTMRGSRGGQVSVGKGLQEQQALLCLASYRLLTRGRLLCAWRADASKRRASISGGT